MDQQQAKILVNSFAEFLAYTLDYMGYEMAPIQRKMAEALASGNPRIGLIASRGFSKTTIVSSYICWRWLRCPHLKVKVLSNSFNRASEITAHVLHQIRTLPILSHLKPDVKSVNRTRFRLKGSWPEKDYSLTATSVYSKLSGSRADLVIADDAASDQTQTQALRDVILASLQECSALLHPVDSRPFYKRYKGNIPKYERTQFVCVGTYESVDSVYRIPDDMSPHPLRGANVYHFPALNEQGESNFPERFSTDYLKEIRDKYTSGLYWACQFQCDPASVQSEARPFKIDKIRAHSTEAPDTATWFAAVDPSFADGNDYFVLTIGNAANGKIYIIDQKGWNTGGIDNVVEQMCVHIKQHCPKLKTISVEINNSAYDVILQTALRKHGILASVVPYRSHTNKLERIINIMEPLLNSGTVVITPKALTNTQLLREFNDFTYSNLPKNDDFVDCMTALVEQNKSKVGTSGKARIAYGSFM
jgi:predicted phage terminase large subunit-like protein